MMVTVAPEGPSRSVSTATCLVAASPVLRVTCLKGAEEIKAMRDTPASGGLRAACMPRARQSLQKESPEAALMSASGRTAMSTE